jgi:hypothetical protein
MYPMVLLVDKAQVEARFGLFGYSANLDARLVRGFVEHTKGSEIIFEETDGTPM